MTEADRALLMAKYVELSEDLRDLYQTEIAGSEKASLEYEKDHLIRCAFFADMLEDME